MIKKIIFIILVLVAQTSVAQRKIRADKFFEKGDYITAAKLYEEDLKKDHYRKTVENIAICYYNTFQYKMAALYLKKIVTGRFKEMDKTYDNEFNFKLYHVLSALGEYEAGLDYFKLYKENLDVVVEKANAIETIEEFKLKTPDYIINSVSFNSPQADFGAVKYKDSIYFTSDRNVGGTGSKKYKWTHQSFLDIYTAKANKKLDSIGSISGLPTTINSKLHEGNFCFSKDGNTIYVSRSNYTNGKKEFNAAKNNNIHLYVAKKVKGKWGELTKLPFNQNGFSYQHPAISPDDKLLYFSSDQAGGFGSFDIYSVEIANGTFGTPTNLGDKINTPNREHFPFISEEGNLFFSSNGHLGLGMLDIYVSELINNTFSSPLNLGVPINSQYDDFNLNYYNKTEGFFASNRVETNDDIYKFTQIGEIFVREYINTIEVRDLKTLEPIANSKVVLTNNENTEIYTNTLGETGAFNITILAGKYKLKAESTNYKINTIDIRIAEQQNQKHIIYLEKNSSTIDPEQNIVEQQDLVNATTGKNITEKPINPALQISDPKRFEMLSDKKGPPIVEKDGKLIFELEPIYFDYDMWNIRSDSKKILDALSQKLERYPTVYLKIKSHTDNRGTDSYNQVLSEKRAESTRNYLALEGFVNARRLQFQGFGESKLKENCSDNCSEAQHQLNRRSEFEIIKY